MSDPRRLLGPLAAIIALAAVLVLLEVSGQAFWQGLFVNIGIFVILVVSLNLSSGFTGVFSLGHIGFMALGAYFSAILTLSVKEVYIKSSGTIGAATSFVPGTQLSAKVEEKMQSAWRASACGT